MSEILASECLHLIPDRYEQHNSVTECFQLLARGINRRGWNSYRKQAHPLHSQTTRFTVNSFEPYIVISFKTTWRNFLFSGRDQKTWAHDSPIVNHAWIYSRNQPALSNNRLKSVAQWSNGYFDDVQTYLSPDKEWDALPTANSLRSLNQFRLNYSWRGVLNLIQMKHHWKLFSSFYFRANMLHLNFKHLFLSECYWLINFLRRAHNRIRTRPETKQSNVMSSVLCNVTCFQWINDTLG